MFSASDFGDDTAFERFALERLGTHRVRLDEKPGSVHDIRGKGPAHIYVKLGTATTGTKGREELRESLRPLGMAAAFKVLDMLVEHVLRANGAPLGRLRFADKKRLLAGRPPLLPVPLDSQFDYWDRLANLYKAFEDARHAITHRRAEATVAGDIDVYDARRRLSDTIGKAEIGSFAAVVHATADVVIDGRNDSRRLNVIAWHLNALDSRHRLPLLSADDPDAARRVLVVDLAQLDDGQLRLDIGRAKEAIEGQALSYWDLELHDENRLFIGRWEDLPDGTATAFDFHPASPPKWLSEEVGANSALA